MGLQFRVDESFPQTMRMLNNFVRSKIMLVIGEGSGEMPKRILQMAATEAQWEQSRRRLAGLERELTTVEAQAAATALELERGREQEPHDGPRREEDGQGRGAALAPSYRTTPLV